MFTVQRRDEVRRLVLVAAAADPAVVAAAITGSYALDANDQWSDIDLAFAVSGDLSVVMGRWTEMLYQDFGALHHWDLRSGASIYRVFLLPDWLEVDLAFTPAAQFGPRGPQWRPVFGDAISLPPDAGGAARRDELIGLSWHHLLHARICIERGKPWQAEWLIAGLRDHVAALGCLRLGYATWFAKGTDQLPGELTVPLEATLVRSLDAAELRRALGATADALAAELERSDPPLAQRLSAAIADLVRLPA